MSKQSRDFVNGWIVGSNLSSQSGQKKQKAPSSSPNISLKGCAAYLFGVLLGILLLIIIGGIIK